MTVISQERKYFAERLREKYGQAYASVLCTMAGLECRAGKPKSRDMARRILNAKLDGFRQSAVLILQADDYNDVGTEEQAKELVRLHRFLYREAFEKDEKDKETWV
jgi:hypothetical protein